MGVDLEKILRPVDNPMEPFPPKYVTLASGEDMVIRQVGRDEFLGQGMYRVLGKAFWAFWFLVTRG